MAFSRSDPDPTEWRPPGVRAFGFDGVIKNGYIETPTSKELKRWLEKQGATFTPGKGSHLHVELHGRFSVLPMHGKDLGNLANAIKKQLGMK